LATDDVTTAASRRRALQSQIITDSAQLNSDIQAFAQSFLADPIGSLEGLSSAVASAAGDFNTQI